MGVPSDEGGFKDDLGSVGFEPNADARQWAMFAHLAALSGYVLPFGNVIGPLVVWLVKKDEFPFVDDQGKESLNFHISMLIYLIVSGILIFVCIGAVTTVVVIVVDIVYTILAGMAANRGERFRYPITIRFLQ